jgi:hypothetical protein
MPGKQAKALSTDHIDDLLFFADNSRHPLRNRLIVLLSVKAGLRAAEIAKLTWDMVVDPTGEIGTILELHDRVAKKGSGRSIPLHRDLREVLIAMRRLQPSHGVVVRSERGGPMTPLSIVVWFSRAYKALGFEGCSSHSGRRTFITRAARIVHKAGGSLRDVQLLAGHRSIQTTQRYIDGDSDVQRRLVAMLWDKMNSGRKQNVLGAAQVAERDPTVLAHAVDLIFGTCRLAGAPGVIAEFSDEDKRNAIGEHDTAALFNMLVGGIGGWCARYSSPIVPPLCLAVSPRRKDKDLARVNQIRIADLLPVRLVNDGIAGAHTIPEAAEAPEAIAAGDGGGCDLRQDHGGGRAFARQSGRHRGHQLRLLCAAARMELAICLISTDSTATAPAIGFGAVGCDSTRVGLPGVISVRTGRSASPGSIATETRGSANSNQSLHFKRDSIPAIRTVHSIREREGDRVARSPPNKLEHQADQEHVAAMRLRASTRLPISGVALLCESA